jgi:hypothetical protein
MVFSTKLGKISSTSVFLDGKTMHGHNMYANLWSQMNSTFFIRKNPLTINNIISFTKPICVTSFILNLLAVDKN